MDHLFARVNDRKNKYRKVLSGVRTYRTPATLQNSVIYEPDNVLDDEQWFFIDNFSEKEYCIDFVKQEKINSTDYAEINKLVPEKISYLVAYQNENEFLFQRVHQSTLIRDKKFIHIGDDIEIKEEKHGIMINEVPDAVYVRDEDKLFFMKLETIAPIFRGIDQLYREATQEETEKFLQNKFIVLEEGFCADSVKKANRKRIALAMNTLKAFSPKQRRDVFKYTYNYFPGLSMDGKTFVIKGDEDLKKLLFGIEQRLFTTPITKEKKCASAVYSI